MDKNEEDRRGRKNEIKDNDNNRQVAQIQIL